MYDTLAANMATHTPQGNILMHTQHQPLEILQKEKEGTENKEEKEDEKESLRIINTKPIIHKVSAY